MDIEQLDLDESNRQLRNYRILWILDALLLILCACCLSASLLLKTGTYNRAISLSPATETSIRQAAYLEAISLYPQRPDAYLCLLDSFGDDGVFSKEESEAFLGCYNSNHNKLSAKYPGYAQIHGNAGLMYVNAYPADPATRLRMALPFLEKARNSMNQEDPTFLTVKCYCNIGSFYKDYIWNTTASVREVSKEQMEQLVDEIGVTLTALGRETAPDAVYNWLGFSTSVCNLFYDQRDILAATVAEQTVSQVLDQIYEALPEEGSLQREQTRSLRQILAENESFYRDALQRAYGRTEAVT